MAIARWLETDTYSNKDISTAVSIGVYTADADRFVLPQLLIDQAAGNGDYVYYVTLQVGGAGSSYVFGPKTVAAAASGETAIGSQGSAIFVRSGDVLTVYVDGLAGDTSTPDTIVRWAEMAALQPTDAGRTLDILPTGEASANVTLWKGEAVADLQAAGRVDANVTMWMGEEPAGLDGLGRLPVGTLHEIDLDSFSGSTVVASSAGDVRNYLVGLVVFLEYEAAPP